jgi:hypothetical protein
MKPGDKIWYLDKRREMPREAEIEMIGVETTRRGRKIITITIIDWDLVVAIERYGEIVPMPCIHLKPEEVFLSREALCEHYRKIFE